MKVVKVGNQIINCEEIMNIETDTHDKVIIIFFKNCDTTHYAEIPCKSNSELSKILETIYEEMTS